MSSFNNKKYKRPKQKTQSTTNPESSRKCNKVYEKRVSDTPLAAKDSEWVDILQTSASESITSTALSDDEEILQLVDCEDGPQMKPLAIMFPDLLEKDPSTLEGVLNKVMSTTEVTKHLVDLGQKANFTFMKKADHLIPRDKQWLERLTENSNSFTSMTSGLIANSVSSDYDADNEITSIASDENKVHKTKNTVKRADTCSNSFKTNSSSDDNIKNTISIAESNKVTDFNGENGISHRTDSISRTKNDKRDIT